MPKAKSILTKVQPIYLPPPVCWFVSVLDSGFKMIKVSIWQPKENKL